MRLLRADSLEFEEVDNSWDRRYAILSHVWVKNKDQSEVSFQDFALAKKYKSPDLAKIRGCCSLAQKWGLEYVWIDTCCINKESSSELSEAINSMYDWYSLSEECYVYLHDVCWDEDNVQQSKVCFQRSKWFTRGWTLQELLAPVRVLFFDQNWHEIGPAKQFSEEIRQATGIDGRYLQSPSEASVAMRMSWAATRETTRGEDRAYSLLGLFDVNMPLLYGEGEEKAFLRLQLEILKQSDDESIFAWTFPKGARLRRGLIVGGMLAQDPSWFVDSKDIFLKDSKEHARMPYAMTNKGLQFSIPLRHGRSYESQMYGERRSNATVPLNCWRKVPIEARAPKPWVKAASERKEGRVVQGEKKEIDVGEENESQDARQTDSDTDDGSEDSDAGVSKTKDMVIAIRLKREGGIWQRVNRDGPFELRKRLPESFKEGSRTTEFRTAMVYVKQADDCFYRED